MVSFRSNRNPNKDVIAFHSLNTQVGEFDFFPSPESTFPRCYNVAGTLLGSCALHFCQSRDLLLESESSSADPDVKIGVPHLQESSDMLILGTKLPLLLQC